MRDIALVWNGALGEADIALAGPVAAAPVPAVNLITNSNTAAPLSAFGWPATASTDVAPPVPGATVWKAVNNGSSSLVGNYPFALTAGVRYSGSVYVWVPSGTGITTMLVSLGPTLPLVNLGLTGQWQRAGDQGVIPAFSMLDMQAYGNVGDFFYYSAPQVEFGPVWSAYQPGSAYPGAGPLTPPLAQIPGADLLTDDGLETAVIVSLFTDAPADPGDAIPDGTTNRRGWWGDMPVDAAAQTGTPDVTGSKLWLLDRAVLNTETLARAESYALAALAWMKRDGVAGKVTARATSPQRGWLTLAIDVFQAGGNRQFSYTWQAT